MVWCIDTVLYYDILIWYVIYHEMIWRDLCCSVWNLLFEPLLGDVTFWPSPVSLAVPVTNNKMQRQNYKARKTLTLQIHMAEFIISHDSFYVSFGCQ